MLQARDIIQRTPAPVIDLASLNESPSDVPVVQVKRENETDESVKQEFESSSSTGTTAKKQKTGPAIIDLTASSDADDDRTSLTLNSVGPSNHITRNQESSLVSKNPAAKLWVKFKSNNAVKVSIDDCQDVDDFLNVCKKELSPLLDSYACAQLFLCTTAGGTPLEPYDPLPDANTGKTPLLISHSC